ncbi:hypothetical protein ACQPZJ_03395 [Actinoplanes sp. CA-054009]
MKTISVVGLIVGAVGIALLWAGGVEFPVAVPPGIVILLVGAMFVAWAPWRWAPVVGVALGAFITVGFLISGDSGALVAAGQAIQLAGVWVGAVAGALALRRPATTGA